jgi:hypothetical protein
MGKSPWQMRWLQDTALEELLLDLLSDVDVLQPHRTMGTTPWQTRWLQDTTLEELRLELLSDVDLLHTHRTMGKSPWLLRWLQACNVGLHLRAGWPTNTRDMLA